MAAEFLELHSARILVVASDLRLRVYLSELLLENFADVHFTQTGQTAINSLNSCAYDVVICDYYLQDMDGIALRNKMVAITNAPYFILLTAHAADSNIQNQLAKDSFVVQQKPPHPDELVFKIRSWFKTKKVA